MENGVKTRQIVEFVPNLNHSNYKDHIDTIVNSVNIIISVSDLSIYGLEKLAGVRYSTLKKILINDTIGIFRTYNRLNNFVKKVIISGDNREEYKEIKEGIEMLILDENITGDIN